MKTFEFEKLEIKPEESPLKRLFNSSRFRKTLRFAALGAIAGYVLFLLSNDMDSIHYWNGEAFESILIGMAFGIFITNSPCARGRC